MRVNLIRIMVGMGLASVAALSAGAEERVGVAAAVNADTTSTRLAGPAGVLTVGADVMFKEHIATSDQGQAQLLFVDQSTVTVANNSELVIDEFVFDPAKNTGKMAATVTKGLLRYVGGKLSKETDVTFTTPTSVISVRGGIALINVAANGSTEATFLFGNHVCVTASAKTNCMNRPGYSILVPGAGQLPSAPTVASAAKVNSAFKSLSGQVGKTAGAAKPPDDQKVGASLSSALSSGTLPSDLAPNMALVSIFSDQHIWQKGSELPPPIGPGSGPTHLPPHSPGGPPGPKLRHF
jgi:hypothetical protein